LIADVANSADITANDTHRENHKMLLMGITGWYAGESGNARTCAFDEAPATIDPVRRPALRRGCQPSGCDPFQFSL
jgi:hypothetical protein